ncbi:MAG TPA: hypothetical protein VJQ57_09310 [Acidimicrobiia bacterium]|nr:hypothetical protein [Acidimicrobiia bacterium]
MQQLWTGPFQPAHIADGSALASSTTLTDISPSPPIVVPANFLAPGMALRVRAAGRVSTTSTPTLLLGVYVGGVAGTAICTTGAITTTSGVTNVTWGLEAWVVCRTIGSSGTVLGTGLAHGISGTVGVSTVPLPASAPATVTWDSTAAKSLTIGAQWGTSSASNTITCHQFIVEVIG